jgi:hypothetical protein
LGDNACLAVFGFRFSEGRQTAAESVRLFATSNRILVANGCRDVDLPDRAAVRAGW